MAKFNVGDKVKPVEYFNDEYVYTISDKVHARKEVMILFRNGSEGSVYKEYHEENLYLVEAAITTSETIKGFLINVNKRKVQEIEIETAFLEPMIKRFLAGKYSLPKDIVPGNTSFNGGAHLMYYNAMAPYHDEQVQISFWGRLRGNAIIIGNSDLFKQFNSATLTLEEVKSEVEHWPLTKRQKWA